jgi:hypothetical protein
MTVSCPKCGKQLLVDDIVVKTAQQVRKLQTCGRIVVHAKGRVVADLVEAHEGIEVRGEVVTKAFRGGLVEMKASARWKGDCHAPALAVEQGARIFEGFFEVGDRFADYAASSLGSAPPGPADNGDPP